VLHFRRCKMSVHFLLLLKSGINVEAILFLPWDIEYFPESESGCASGSKSERNQHSLGQEKVKRERSCERRSHWEAKNYSK
jgi:hypothetical protein